MEQISRAELLRFNVDKWEHHWINRVLVAEYCQRHPEECHSIEKDDYAVSRELSRFDYTVAANKRVVRTGFTDDLVTKLRGGLAREPVVGEYLRDLTESSEAQFRIIALKIAVIRGLTNTALPAGYAATFPRQRSAA